MEVLSLELGGRTGYHCVLCGDRLEGMAQMLEHLRKLSHKLHYLVSVLTLASV